MKWSMSLGAHAIAGALGLALSSGAALAQAGKVRGQGYCDPVEDVLLADRNGDGGSSHDPGLAASCMAPDRALGLASRAALLYADGKVRLARAELDAALAARADSATALRLKCEILRNETPDLEQARAACDRAVAAAPNWSRARLQLAVVLEDQEDLTGARAALDEAVRLEPDSVVPRIRRAAFRNAYKDKKGALEDLQAAHGMASRTIDEVLLTASLAASLGYGDAADKIYDEVLKVSPRHPLALKARAAARKARKDYRGAISDYDSLIAARPRDGTALVGRGELFALAGDLAKAEADFRKAITVDARPAARLMDLARLQAAMQRNADADASIRRALEQEPDAPEVLALYGEVLVIQGKPVEALDQQRRAQRLADAAGLSSWRYGKQADDLADDLAEPYREAYGERLYSKAKTYPGAIAARARVGFEDCAKQIRHGLWGNDYAYHVRALGGQAGADRKWQEAIASSIEFQKGCLRSNLDSFAKDMAAFTQAAALDQQAASAAWAALDKECVSGGASRNTCSGIRDRALPSKAYRDKEIASTPRVADDVRKNYEKRLGEIDGQVRALAAGSRDAYLKEPGKFNPDTSNAAELARTVGAFGASQQGKR